MESSPDLVDGYSWQFVDADGSDCTSTPLYAVDDAVEARIWCENGDLVLVLKRSDLPGRAGAWEASEGPEAVAGRAFADLDEAVDMITTLGWFTNPDKA